MKAVVFVLAVLILSFDLQATPLKTDEHSSIATTTTKENLTSVTPAIIPTTAKPEGPVTNSSVTNDTTPTSPETPVTTTTLKPSSSTNATTVAPTKGTTVTTPAPSTSSSTTNKTPTTSELAPTVPAPTGHPHKDRKFDGPSFIGGIVLACGIMSIAFVGLKFYKARTERNYHTL